MKDRFQQLLDENEILYGLLCRDPTTIQLELMALAGYHVVWLDLEHAPLTNEHAVELGRTISHLGMVPLVRIPELARTHVQVLLDGGICILNLPDVRSAGQAAEFVRLGKYPPLGKRGVSTTTANLDYVLKDPQKDLAAANSATRLMVMIESDQGYSDLDAILDIEGLDMITVGPSDWSVQSGCYDVVAKQHLAEKIEHVFKAATKAGKITVHNVSDVAGVRQCRDWGVRVMMVGVDVHVQRKALADTLDALRNARD